MRIVTPALLTLSLFGCELISTPDRTRPGENAAPEVEITAPVASGTYMAGEAITLTATVSDDADAPGDLQVIWRDESGVLDLGTTPDENGGVSGSMSWEAGTHKVTLTVTDTEDESSTAEVEFTVSAAENHAPTCEIVDPQAGDSGTVGAAVTLGGKLTDEDGGVLTATWSSDLQGGLGGGAVGGDGVSSVEAELAAGTHVLTLTGTDDKGATCTDTVTYAVFEGPTVAILSPGDGLVANEGAPLEFRGTATDDLTDAEDLAVRWVDDVSGVLNTTAPDASGGISFITDTLARGPHTTTLEVTDYDGVTTSVSVDFVINGLPTAPTVAIDPSPAYDDDVLSASVVGPSVDPELDAVSYSYAWTVDGAPTTITDATVDPGSTARGQVWEVTITPSDAYGAGAPGMASVTIANRLPVVASATLTPDPAGTTDTLVCTAGALSDGDGDAVTASVSWTVAGAVLPVTTDTLDSSWFTRGDSVSCTVTPNDGFADGASVTSNTVSISNAAPSLASAAITPAVAYVGDTLTCAGSGFSDADGDADQSTYAWNVNGAAAGSGATLIGGFVGRDVVECTATPFDGTDVGTPVVASLTVGNSLPVTTSVTVSPSAPTAADTLTCTPGPTTDADGTTSFTYSYTWTVNGSTVGSGDVLAGVFVKGDSVVCSVAPNDGTADGSWVSASAVTIANTAPVVSAVALSPTLIYEGSTVSCTPTASDADGDSIAYTYAWSVNGAAVAATGSTLTGTYFNKGDSVVCAATPNDGALSGSVVSSSATTVGNTAPTAPVAAVSPSAPEAGIDAIECSLSTASTDADPGDVVSYTFSWTQNGAAYTGATSAATTSAVAPSAVADGDVFVCTVTATDGTATSSASTATATALGPIYYAGYYTAFGSNSTVGANYLYAEKVTISAAADLYTMGYGGRSGNTGNVMMALYTDSGGAPGTLLGYTTAISPVGMEEVDVTTAPVALTAGTYWMAWEVGSSTLKGTYTATCSGVVTYYKSYTYGTFPSSWPSGASSVTGQCNNIYLGLR